MSPDKLEKLDSQILDATGLQAWFAAMASAATDAVTVKDSKSSNGRRATLHEAMAAWESGAIVAVQVRWSDGSTSFVDTIVPAAHGVRRVRIQL